MLATLVPSMYHQLNHYTFTYKVQGISYFFILFFQSPSFLFPSAISNTSSDFFLHVFILFLSFVLFFYNTFNNFCFDFAHFLAINTIFFSLLWYVFLSFSMLCCNTFNDYSPLYFADFLIILSMILLHFV